MVGPRTFLTLLLVMAISGGALAEQQREKPARKLAPGERFAGSVPLEGTAQAIALPAGDWTVVARIEEQGPYALVLLAKTEGGHLQGLIWARSAATPIGLGTWCAAGGGRQLVEPLRSGNAQAGDAEEGCLWVRQWSTGVNPEDLDDYWWRAFERLRQDGVDIPSGLIAAGYHIADGAAALTIEYSFNADDVNAQQVASWARDWQDAVVAAYRGRPAQSPSPAWP